MGTKDKRVLITGAAGFIGSELCRQLQSGSQPLTLLQRSAPVAHCLQDDPDITVIHGELTDPAVAGQACQGARLVFHLAGIAHTDSVNEKQLFDSHVEGTRVLLQQAQANGVQRLVYISSSLAEEAEVKPARASPYARAKLEAEQVVLAANRTGDIDAVILRPVNVYGVGMKGTIRRLMERIVDGFTPPLPRLATRVSLVGVGDLCRAAILAGNARESAGKTYTVTDGERYGINDIEAAIYHAAGRKKPGWHTPRVLVYAAALARLGGLSPKAYHNLISDNLFSNEALCNDLGFAPTTSFYTELPAILASLSSQHH
jgi:nucleoside-diphosphate-sugar epimerase